MADIPEGIAWGTVAGHFGEIGSDSADPGRVPDVSALAGTVTLMPSVPWLQVPGEGRYKLKTLVCPVIDGVLCPPDTTDAETEADVPVVASGQPGSVPEYIQWTATFDLDGVEPQPLPVVFNVPAAGTVDLAAQMGAEEQLPYVVVVSTEDAVRAEAAASTAVSASQSASGSRSSAEQFAGAASSSAASAGVAVQNAGESAAAALAARDEASTARDAAIAARDAAVAAIPVDSGPVAVTLSAGIVGSINVRRIGKMVMLQGTVTGIASVASTEKSIGSIPADYRPAERVAGPAYFYSTGGADGATTVSSTGTIQVVQHSGARDAVTVSAIWFE